MNKCFSVRTCGKSCKKVEQWSYEFMDMLASKFSYMTFTNKEKIEARLALYVQPMERIIVTYKARHTIRNQILKSLK